jgi:lipid A 3-O-deacylase
MQRIFGLALLFLAAANVQAVDSVSAELGHGSRKVEMWRVGAQWNQNPARLAGTRWSLAWDAALGGWHSDAGTVYDLGLTPVLRYAHSSQGAYADGGIGVHWLSSTHISSALDFSTRFQFGDHVGVGYRLERYDVSLRFQHLSNAGIRNPNPGINFLQLRLRYELR